MTIDDKLDNETFNRLMEDVMGIPMEQFYISQTGRYSCFKVITISTKIEDLDISLNYPNEYVPSMFSPLSNEGEYGHRKIKTVYVNVTKDGKVLTRNYGRPEQVKICKRMLEEKIELEDAKREADRLATIKPLLRRYEKWKN